MYAVWGETEPVTPRLLSQLGALGVEKVVVEADDEDVADAQLRLSTYDEPVAAIVSVWTDGDPAKVTDLLARAVPRLAGWVVEERQPLPPPRTPHGARADALVNVALLRIPDGMTTEAWRERWLEHHTPVAIETQATFGYVQNVVVEPLLEDQPPVAALVEEFFPMAATADLHAFYGSEGDDEELTRRMTAMLESVATFGAHEHIDVIPTSRYEIELTVGG